MKHISLALENLMKVLLNRFFENHNLELSVVCFMKDYNSAVIKDKNNKLIYVDNVSQLIENLQVYRGKL